MVGPLFRPPLLQPILSFISALSFSLDGVPSKSTVDANEILVKPCVSLHDGRHVAFKVRLRGSGRLRIRGVLEYSSCEVVQSFNRNERGDFWDINILERIEDDGNQ